MLSERITQIKKHTSWFVILCVRRGWRYLWFSVTSSSVCAQISSLDQILNLSWIPGRRGKLWKSATPDTCILQTRIGIVIWNMSHGAWSEVWWRPWLDTCQIKWKFDLHFTTDRHNIQELRFAHCKDTMCVDFWEKNMIFQFRGPTFWSRI